MDEARTLTMSRKELNRLEILGRALERRLTQAQAAEQLGLSVRQVERLCRKLRVEGAPQFSLLGIQLEVQEVEDQSRSPRQSKVA